MSPRIEMLYDRLLIQHWDEAESKTSGGIILPAIEQQNTMMRYGTVREVGAGRPTAHNDAGVIPLRVKKGDVVMWMRTTDGSQFGLPALDGSMLQWFVIQETHVVARLHGMPQRSALVDPHTGEGLVLS